VRVALQVSDVSLGELVEAAREAAFQPVDPGAQPSIRVPSPSIRVPSPSIRVSIPSILAPSRSSSRFIWRDR
jgi:hypothetical protein